MEKTARAVIIDDGKLLVFFRRKVMNGEVINYYALPGGHMDNDETLENTVIREVREEMNLDVEIIDYLGKLIIDNQEENYYYCKIVGGNIQFGGEELERCNDSNYYEIRWLDIGEIDNSGIRAIDMVKKVVGLEYEN